MNYFLVLIVKNYDIYVQQLSLLPDLYMSLELQHRGYAKKAKMSRNKKISDYIVGYLNIFSFKNI